MINKYKWFFIVLINCMIINAQPRMATVSGNVFLSDATNHSGVKILFEAVSASATTDSVYSGTDGSFVIGLTDGLYIVHYSKNGFIPYTLPTTYSWGNNSYTLPDVTLLAGSVIQVSGNVSGTWYTNSLVQVTGDITIPNQQTLTIEPGVIVHFMGSYRWFINGSIFAVGTETDSIFITSGQPIKSSTDWKGIFIEGQGEADTNRTLLFQYVDIGYGGTSDGLFYIQSLYGRVPFQFMNSTMHDYSNQAIYSESSNSKIHDSYFELSAGSVPLNLSNDYSSEILDNNFLQADNYSRTFSYSFPYGDNESHSTRFSGNHFSGSLGYMYNVRPDNGKDTLTINNNIFMGNSSYNSLITNNGNYTLIKNNQFLNGLIFSDNDESIFRNNYVKSTTRLNSNASPTMENNIFQNGYFTFIGNNGASTIAYNTFVNYVNFNDPDAPIGLGTILTTNANGDPADTYLNIFKDPLYIPSDSTIFLAYTIVDSVITLMANPRTEWANVSSVYWQIRKNYNNYSHDVWFGLANIDTLGVSWFKQINMRNDSWFNSTPDYPVNQMGSIGFDPSYGYHSEFNNRSIIDHPQGLIYMAYSDNPDPNSPTIDAGNPAAELYDPDGTVADIGHRWYNQGNVAAPVADFTANTTSGSEPTFVEFSFAGSGAVTGYSWNFGDGATSTSFRPVHRYEEGTYSVSLTVTGPGGSDTEVKTDFITVSGPSTPPVVSFYAEQTTGIVPMTVQFQATVNNGYTSLSWNFGDGSASTEEDPSHTYSTAGVYSVSLSATNTHGTDSETMTDYIHVLEPTAVAAQFIAAPLLGVAPLAVAFTNNSVGTIDSVLWEFSDGSVSRLTSPVHTFANPGNYSVELTVYGVVNSDTLLRSGYVSVFDAKPVITSITDVPNDQGGQVLLSWQPSGWDGPVGTTVSQYSLWEKYNSQWVNINTAMANQSASYLFLANTFGDSSSAGANWSKFKVIAHTPNPAVFYESLVDSGYSMDNIAPEAPGTLLATTTGNGVELEWGTNNEANFMYYEVIRNDEVIEQLTDNTYLVSTASFPMPAFYRIQSVDDAGNVSPPTNSVLVNLTTMDWYLHISADVESGAHDHYNFLGVAETATDGFDENYDIYEPPLPPGNYVSLSFNLEDTTATQNNFAQLVNESINLADHMQSWNMTVKTSASDTVTISFNVENISGFPLMLENLETSTKYEMGDNGSYEFYAIGDSNYHFLVSIGDSTAPQLALGPSCSGPAIINSGDVHEFNWTMNDGYMLDAPIVYISLDSGATYNTIFELTGEATNFSWSVPNIPMNFGGKVKVQAKDYAGNTTEKESDYVFAIVGDTLSFAVEPGWTLLGLPSAPDVNQIDQNIDDDFNGYWHIYGFEDGGYVFDSLFTVGKGYWLSTMENAVIDIVGEPTASAVEMNVNAGWNLVTNPFVLNVSKDSLLITNLADSSTYYFNDAVNAGLINTAYTFDGNGYVEANEFNAWDGFWLGALNDNIRMRIPIHRQPDGLRGNNRDENDWTISFEGTIANAYDRTTVLGVAENATDGFDPAFDVVKAPLSPGIPFISMYFLHEDWNLILGDRIAKDIKSPISTNEFKEWSFHINTNEHNANLKWEINNIPEIYEAGISLDGGSYFSDLFGFDSISVLNGAVIIVRVGYNVLGIDENIIPEKFALHQNYPNPFNPMTTIKYDLPQKAHVNIIIYDIMGREVKQLVNETLEAGFKSVVWNGTNASGLQVSAGMYLYQIKTSSGFAQTKKLVLLK